MEQRSNKRVLLIDYDPRSIGQIRSMLRAAGYEIHIANNGTKGIESFEELRPDLTLVQDLIPGKSGAEVCQILKKTEHGGQSSICMLVSNGRRGVRFSCDASVAKPFTEEALLEKVVELIGPGTTEPKRPARPAIPVEFNEAELTARLDSLMFGPSDGAGRTDA